MIQKGTVTAVNATLHLVTVSPLSGGIVTPWIVLPFYLYDSVSVGDSVVYTVFSDNTGIVLQKADGTGALSREVYDYG